MIKVESENERREFVLNSMESNVVINKSENPKKRSFIKMKFDGIEVCQNARYKYFFIPIDTFFNYKRIFQMVIQMM